MVAEVVVDLIELDLEVDPEVDRQLSLEYDFREHQ